MGTFVRFQTRCRCTYTGRPGGIFVAAGLVEDSRHLPESTRTLLQDALRWFSYNLTVPRLGDRNWRSIFWFRAEAQDLISELWNLISILQDEGIHVRKLWTREPGQIVYEDQHQVAAIPQRRSQALRF